MILSACVCLALAVPANQDHPSKASISSNLLRRLIFDFLLSMAVGQLAPIRNNSLFLGHYGAKSNPVPWARASCLVGADLIMGSPVVAIRSGSPGASPNSILPCFRRYHWSDTLSAGHMSPE